MINIPDYKRLSFGLDRDRGRYLIRICPPGFAKVPAELIVEERRTDVIRTDVNLVLRGPKTHKEGTKRRIDFFTGLRPTQYPDVFDGDVLTDGLAGKVVKNYILVRFTPDADRLTLLFFPAYRLYPNQRSQFVAELFGRGLL